MVSMVLGLVAERYPCIAKDLLKPLLELLTVSRQVCGGDIDKFLILLVVGVRTAEHPVFASLSASQLARGDIPVLPSLGTNARSIADSMGIPKETIRRKVGELIEAGWLVRRDNDLLLTGHAFEQLSPVREAVEMLAASNWGTVSALLADVG
ncbi:hypothetical protein DJ021_13705 [Phenylobacterium hankyongense]|uniref:HTH crp-type domain-containing protein n=1 Tax=Phenylobacterium hankyongense TaxID=1813876 RepID=A0A328B4E9_9CAUL|nr:hypothetical protein [Phenylobacterium hankyongense]RAK60786.1 hypothetical protein DJ021_13705 [Phenylobacterium hankyongense]